MRNLCFAALVAAVPSFADAASYSMSGLSFGTATRQSTWGSGDAAEIAGTTFAGAEWNNAKVEVGGIAGEPAHTETIPNPTYLVELGAYELCKATNIFGDCGSGPSATIPITVPDSRTGAKFDITTSGKTGIDLNYKLSAGSVDATVIYDISAVLPDNPVKVGQGFTIDSGSIFSGGAIDSQSPTAEASADLVFKLQANGSVTACAIPFGCTSDSGQFLNIDEDRELIAIDPNEITYLGGFTGDYVSVTTPLANQSVNLKAGLINGTPGVYVEGPFIPDVNVAGITTDLGQIEFTVPIFEATGEKLGNSLVVNGRGDLLDIRADLDGLLAVPGGGSTSLGPLGLSFDLYDVDAGPSLDIFQDLVVTPELMVSFDFSKPVEIAGQLVDSFAGAWNSLPEMKIFDVTTFVPTFSISAIMESVAGLQIGLELVVDILKGHAGVGAFGLDLLSADFGPLFSKDFAYDPEWAKLALFSDSFALGGFQTVAGDPFTLRPDDLGEVPLPASLPLLLVATGLLGAGFGRQRRR